MNLGDGSLEKLLKNFKYIIIIVLALAIVFILSNQYRSINEVITDKYQSRQQLVEKNILQTVNYINNSYKVVEQELNREMKEYSEEIVAKYQKNPSVMNWNLEDLKGKFQYYDIYIIDQNLKIIKTTNKDDLGLDFSKFGSFSQIIKGRLEGNSFAVDRIDLATQTGEVKKYSYQPSPDNKYLFELSIAIEDKYPSFKQLNMFVDASKLTADYDIVEEIAFYSVEPINYGVAKLRSSKQPYLDPDVPQTKESLVRQSVLTGEMQAVEIKKSKAKYKLKFFPVIISGGKKDQGWNSYVVGINYNHQVMEAELDKHQYLFASNIILMLIFFIAFIAVIIYLINKFEYQANHDKLTGLANRNLFVEEFRKIKVEADKLKFEAAIIFIDVDKFKEINDNYGHDVGDLVLEKIAKRMENNLRENDRLARMGGDEFVLALTKLSSKTEAIQILKRLIKDLKRPFSIMDKEIEINFSAGVSIYPNDGEKLDKLIKNADLAMYQAKKNGEDIELS